MNSIRRLGEGCLIVLAVSVLLIVQAWPTLVRNGIDVSLRRHATAIRNARISIEDKERLLDLIERLQDRLRDEEVRFFDWTKHDQAIDEMVEDGISFNEVRLIERELRRAGTAFQEPQP